MIKLNDRLQIIAERLKDEKTMADIGTDHGFLPVFLLQSGQCDRVILADISVPSLAKAEENCRRYFTGEYEECAARAEFRAGDGLTVLKPGEVDAVVIAGVGGTDHGTLRAGHGTYLFFSKVCFSTADRTGDLEKMALRPRFSHHS